MPTTCYHMASHRSHSQLMFRYMGDRLCTTLFSVKSTTACHQQLCLRTNHDLTLTPWASYQIRKIAGCACTGNAGNVLPAIRLQWKPPVSDHGMHHGTCGTHVPWCMSGSLTGAVGEAFPAFPAHAQPAILCIWQEAHGTTVTPGYGREPTKTPYCWQVGTRST